MRNSTAPAALFEGIFEKTVVMKFDAERRTSNAGITLLSVLDRKLGLTRRLADCLVSPFGATRSARLELVVVPRGGLNHLRHRSLRLPAKAGHGSD